MPTPQPRLGAARGRRRQGRPEKSTIFQPTVKDQMKSNPASHASAGKNSAIPTPMQPLLLTRKEAAAVLGLKEGTLRTWASLGRGPRYKKLHSGSRAGVRYSVDELREYADDPAEYERRRNGR